MHPALLDSRRLKFVEGVDYTYQLGFIADFEPPSVPTVQLVQWSNDFLGKGIVAQCWGRTLASFVGDDVVVPPNTADPWRESWLTSDILTMCVYGDYIYLIDYLTCVLQKRLLADMSFVAQIGSSGTGDNQFTGPHAGICTDGTYLYIADSGNHRIQKRLCSDLSYVAKIGSLGTGDDQFNGVRGMVTDGTHVYVVDSYNHRIHKRLCSTLAYVSKIGSSGTGNDQFYYPWGLCSDGTNLYISEPDSYRIQKRLCSTLAYVNKIGSNGSGNDQFKYPYCMATDGTYIYISESYGNVRLQMRRCDTLVFVANVGPTYAVGKTWVSPLGLMYNAGKLYVSDRNTGKIDILGTGLNFIQSYGPAAFYGRVTVTENMGFGWVGNMRTKDTPLDLPLPTVTFSPISGTAYPCTVTLSTATAVTAIYYTIDGTDPRFSATRVTYTTGVSVTTAKTFLAVAYDVEGTYSAVSTATYAAAEVAQQPTAIPTGANYYPLVSVTLSTITSGAAIYYTTDGSTPDAGDTLYTTAIEISTPTTLKAVAIKGASTSTVMTEIYTFLDLSVHTPVADNPGTNYFDTVTVALSTTTSGAVIYYTIDGSVPSAAKTLYTVPLAISAATTLKAIAIKGAASSAIMSEAYTFVVATPVAAPHGANFVSNPTVTLTTTTAGAVIYYTIDGSTPNATKTLYTTSIPIDWNTTLKAIAIKSATSSAIMTELYTILGLAVDIPTATPPGSVYAVPASVALATTTAGADIYYTIDGSNPNATKTLYTTAITIATAATLKAVAIKSGVSSAIMTEAYAFSVASPTASHPSASTYSTTFSVVLSTTTAGASIYYTTDLSTPTVGSTLYIGAIPISWATTLRAIATKSGVTSAEAYWTYAFLPTGLLFSYLDHDSDLTGAWGQMFPDGSHDIHCQFRFNVTGLITIKRIELYQLTGATKLWTTGQVWSTSSIVYPLKSGIVLMPDPYINKAVYNIYVKNGDDRIIPDPPFTEHSTLWANIPSGNYTLDLYASVFLPITADYLGLFVYNQANEEIFRSITPSAISVPAS